jgi:gag-polypeptide of LTR copia-type
MVQETIPNPLSSSNNSTNTSTTFTQTINPIVSINLPVSIQLNDTNYLSWKSQILLLVQGHDLEIYLNSFPPDPAIRAPNGQTTINPAYLAWTRQDKLLLAWIRSSLSDSIIAQVNSVTSSRDLWTALESFFTSTSRSRLQELKRQIQTASKGDSSCDEYLLRLRRIADELAFIGAPLPDEDLVTIAINGLGSEYGSLIAALSTVRCHTSFNFSDLRGLLLSHESYLRTQSHSAPQAFHTGRTYGQKQTRFGNQTRPYNTQSSAASHSTPPNANFSKPNSTKTLSPDIITMINSGQIRIPCQICFKMGHITKMCYKRYNKDPNWKPPPQYTAYTVQVDSTPQDQDSSNWIIDSGATNHVTNDLNNLQSYFAYKGPDTLQIGNGISLSISHIGSQNFLLSKIPIKLTNVLHVPHFKTNLLSLSQLLQDNPSLSINFTSSSCILKDHIIKTSPIQISSINGLYSIQMKSSPPPPQALLVNSITTNT